MLSMRFVAVLIPGLFVTGGTALPQDPTRHQRPHQVVARALRALANDGCIVQGSVDQRRSVGAPANRVVTIRPGYFQGEFEAFVDPSRTLAVSTKPVPGFGIYRDKRDKLVHAFYETDPVDVSRVDSELSGLLDFQRMARYVLSVASEDVEFKATGEMTLRGDLPSEFVSPRRTPRGGDWSNLDAEVEALTSQLSGVPGVSRVTRVRTVFTLDREGNLTAARLSVVYTNPVPVSGPSFFGNRVATAGAIIADSDEGEASVYQLSFRKGDLTPALQALEQLSVILLAQK